MEPPVFELIFAFVATLYLSAFWKYSPASKSAKAWITLYATLAAIRIVLPEQCQALWTSTRIYVTEHPAQTALIALSIAIPLKYLQRKLRYARLNAIKWKYGYTSDPKSWQDMTIPQAQEIERNMAEWEFPRLWQWGWISDFFRTSTDPGVSRAINASGHFINEDKKIEHQRMQATVHLITALPTYTVGSRNSSLVIARINEHHHRYGIKINSDDVLYLMIHFGTAPIPWINKFGYRKLEGFEEHAIWTLWRELACRMGCKYVPHTLEQARQWRKNFETTMRWREDANEIMAMAMLNQVLYPVPRLLHGFVKHVFASIVDWDIVHFCQLEKLRPSPITREIVGDLFRFCGFLVREFGLPRLSPYVRSPPGPNEKGNIVFGHTPYDTMPWWQEASFWNLYGPRALFNRVILGLPTPSIEFGSDGVPFEAMGAPHKHPVTQAAIESKVRDNATALEEAPYGYRPSIGFQANRLIGRVDGPEYGIDMNRFAPGTPTTPAGPIRFTRQYERRGGAFAKIEAVEKPEDVTNARDESKAVKEARKDSVTAPDNLGGLQAAPLISAAASDVGVDGKGHRRTRRETRNVRAGSAKTRNVAAPSPMQDDVHLPSVQPQKPGKSSPKQTITSKHWLGQPHRYCMSEQDDTSTPLVSIKRTTASSSDDTDTPLIPIKKRSTFPRTISELVTSQLVPGDMAKSQALSTNMDVDYVIVFRSKASEKVKAAASFEQLCQKLAHVGLATEVRNGKDDSLLVFVKVASAEHMYAEIYRSRVKDWIHGVRAGEPATDVRASLEQDPLTDAERLRIIYQLITNYEQDGGAGIRPKSREWEYVESVFALHDHTFNKQLMTKWATQWQIQTEDLDNIRDRFGEKVAFYFAFEQTYFTFLLAPAAFGLVAWLVLGSFSPLYAVFSCLWATVFIEWWKHKEGDLAIRWGVRGVGNIENKRHDFQPTKEVEDPATGEKQLIFPWEERLKRQLLQIPFAIAAVVVLGSLILLCFAIEIFIGEVYTGPGKSILTFTPTVILTTVLPLLSGVMTNLAKRLNDFENYETDSNYDRQHTGKLFVLNFITSYMGIMLTAFVYVPFGSVLVPYLNVFSRLFAAKEHEHLDEKGTQPGHFTINPDRLRKQVIYFAVTAQLVNFAMEVVVPYLKRQGFLKIKEMTAKRVGAALQSPPSPNMDDNPEEKEFLDRVRSEAELPAYDVYEDLREMIIQFGYLSLFSVVWPLVPLSYLVNNWFELRADAVKICIEMQRPTPWRADTIGPWLDALGFLTWMGSITTPALTYMFSNDGVGPDGRPHDIKAWGLLLSIFFSEHLYLLVHGAVANAISKIDSPGKQKERRDRYETRQRLVQDSLSKLPQTPNMGNFEEKPITRESLEEEARQGSLKTSTAIERFWNRQRNWRESAQVGKGLIDHKMDTKESEKSKKEL